jgi:hypothetical protein
MSIKFNKFKEESKEKGNIVGPLLPAQWVELKGKFTSKEMLFMAKEIDRNYQKITNGTKK